MKKIANEVALREFAEGKAVIIDVREQAEFNENGLKEAINLPFSRFNHTDFEPYKHQKICLICHSGNRSSRVADKLNLSNDYQLFVMVNQMNTLSGDSSKNSSKMWSVDRQFRMTLGVLLTIFLFGYTWVSAYFIIIPIILATGLVSTSLIDRCYMRMGIALLPWNRR